jgi:hypothetical protein
MPSNILGKPAATPTESRTPHFYSRVQDHLSNVFDKVGVRNRQALVKRLFFNSLLSGLNK